MGLQSESHPKYRWGNIQPIKPFFRNLSWMVCFGLKTPANLGHYWTMARFCVLLRKCRIRRALESGLYERIFSVTPTRHVSDYLKHPKDG
jgi:hypothetical protein